MSGALVLVTGGTGFVGGHIAKCLLEAGFNVRVAVRDPENEKKTQFLRDIAQKTGSKVSFARADLTADEGWDTACKDCTFVVHAASPLAQPWDSRDAWNRIINPAVQGTERVMKAAAEAKVKTFLYLSTTFAVNGANNEQGEGHKYNEADWNNSSAADKDAYPYSKMLAEKKAWEVAEKLGLNLICLLPGFIIGPTINGRVDSNTAEFFAQMLKGDFKQGVPELYYGCTDVRDVGEAVVTILTKKPEASGRFLLVGETFGVTDMAVAVKEAYPKAPLSVKTVPRPLLYLLSPVTGIPWDFLCKNIGYRAHYDSTRIAEEFGISKYRSLHQASKDTAEALVKVAGVPEPK